MQERIIIADTNSRPEFSRFEANLANGTSLPIFPLCYPEDGRSGIVIVGDYVAQDFVKYAVANNPNFRQQWIVIGTTQSDAVPTDCRDVDFNLFTNLAGVARYLASDARNVPYSIDPSDGHFVDPQIFYPDPQNQKQWDIVYPAKWYPTKNTEILIRAAQLDTALRVAIYGWPVVSERKIKQSMAYRDYLFDMAKESPNIDMFDSGFDCGSLTHYNHDGSVVVGNLTKAEMRDKFYQKARASIFLSETTESINRACTEMLCCGVPMLVAPTNGGLDRLVTPRSGVMIDRSPEGILDGIHQVLDNYDKFDPRASFLQKYGRDNANDIIKVLVQSIATRKRVDVNWPSYKKYGGDLWTLPEMYRKVFQ